MSLYVFISCLYVYISTGNYNDQLVCGRKLEDITRAHSLRRLLSFETVAVFVHIEGISGSVEERETHF